MCTTSSLSKNQSVAPIPYLLLLFCQIFLHNNMNMNQLYQQSVQRLRSRCQYVTEFSHDTLIKWIHDIVGTDWTVYGPDDGEGEVAGSWPAEGMEQRAVVKALKKMKCNNPQDLVNGHCEAIALILSKKAEQLLRGNEQDFSDLLNKAHEETLGELRGMDASSAAMSVFNNGFMGGIVDKKETWSRMVWGEQFGELTVEDLLYGGSVSVQERIRTFSHRLLGAKEERMVGTIPLYIMNYIFDGDELSDTKMKETKFETAQYSCHVVGLVMDAKHKSVFIADPNGALIPGHSIEFLAVPLKNRHPQEVSTRLSRYDLRERNNLQPNRPLVEGEAPASSTKNFLKKAKRRRR